MQPAQRTGGSGSTCRALARRRVGAAICAGELGLEDGERIMRVLDAVEGSLFEAEKRATLTSLRRALDDGRANGASTRIAALAAQAEMLMRLIPARPGDDAKVIDIAGEPDGSGATAGCRRVGGLEDRGEEA